MYDTIVGRSLNVAHPKLIMRDPLSWPGKFSNKVPFWFVESYVDFNVSVFHVNIAGLFVTCVA